MVVGLGNPGVEYEGSRHNAGFLAVDLLADRSGGARWRRRYRTLYARTMLDGETLLLLKPLTFMNESGSAIVRWREALGLPVDRIIVIHDDLDLPAASVRVKAGGGHGGHKGVRSVMERLGSGDFIRVRVGIGRPGPDPVGYVLGHFADAERPVMEEAIARAADAVEAVVRVGVERARNRYNLRIPRRGRTEEVNDGERV
jgi:PTH1 family peptidyl-tRNA hydrolase